MLSLTVLLFKLPPVPTAPPQNVVVQSSTATQLDVMWDPPPPDAQNGDIQGYKVSIIHSAYFKKANSTYVKFCVYFFFFFFCDENCLKAASKSLLFCGQIYFWEFQLQNETERLRTLFLPELGVKLKNLTGYTTYMISVAAFNAAGDGPRSLPTRGRTQQAGAKSRCA